MARINGTRISSYIMPTTQIWGEVYSPDVPVEGDTVAFRRAGATTLTNGSGVKVQNTNGIVELELRKIPLFNPNEDFYIATTMKMAEAPTSKAGAFVARHIWFMADFPDADTGNPTGAFYFLGNNVDSAGTFTMHSSGTTTAYNGWHQSASIRGTVDGLPTLDTPWAINDIVSFICYYSPSGYRLVIIVNGVRKYDQTKKALERTIIDPSAQIVLDERGADYPTQHHQSYYQTFVVGNGDVNLAIPNMEAYNTGGSVNSATPPNDMYYFYFLGNSVTGTHFA